MRFIEKIFSVLNSQNQNHKIVRFMGIKMQFKRAYTEEGITRGWLWRKKLLLP